MPEGTKFMYTTGDTVVHNRYGPGTVIGVRTLERKGEKRRYFCLEMAGDAGTLMIPEDQLETDEMRPILSDTSLIKEVLFRQPEELTDHHRSRQTKIETALNTRDPRQIAQVLRDLCWRQHIAKLTSTDKRLKNSAMKSLLEELVLNPAYTLLKAEQQIEALIEQAMKHHNQNVAEVS